MDPITAFRLGLAIGDQLSEVSDVPGELLKMQWPSEAMQFAILGVLAGCRIQDPWPILEKLEDDDDPSMAIG